MVTPKRRKVEEPSVFLRLFEDAEEKQAPVDVSVTDIKKILQSLAFRWCKNDVDPIIWSENGTEHKGLEEAVTPISVDSFIMIHFLDSVEIKHQKYFRAESVKYFLERWLRSYGVDRFTIRSLPKLYMDQNCHVGMHKPKPYVKFKVAVADVPLKEVVNLFRNEESRHSLFSADLRLLNMDLKQDYACTVTPEVFEYSKHAADRIFGADEYDYNRQVTRNCISLLRNDGLVRAKIYNKFSECISSPGLSKGKGSFNVGCNIGYWINSPIKSLKKAILDPRTQERGLSRIEVTFHMLDDPETLCKQFLQWRDVFLPLTNHTPICKQWQMLKPEHSVVVYDCVSTQYLLARWKQSQTRAINGFHGKATSFLKFMQRLKLCTLSTVPIDVYLLDSDAIVELKDKDPPQRALTDRFSITNGLKLNDIDYVTVGRGNWRYKHARVFRQGDEKRTYMVGNGFLNSSYCKNKVDHTPEDAGLQGNDLIPVAYQQRVDARMVVENVSLSPKSTQVEMKVIDGIPPDGTYTFVRSFVSDSDLPGRRHSVRPLCIELSNGDIYACFGELAKWKDKFQKDEQFNFTIQDGKLNLHDGLIDHVGKPRSMRTLDIGSVYAVYRISQNAYRGKTRDIVQFSHLPQVGYLASETLIRHFRDGKKCFKATKHGYDDNRNKTMIMQPL